MSEERIDPQIAVLTDWYIRVSEAQRAHYASAEVFGKRKYWLGIPALSLSTVVGTSVFASIGKEHSSPNVQISIGLASIAAALLTSLQTFLGYSERAEKHRVAAAKYGALGRELEVLRASGSSPPVQEIESVRKRLDALALESPNNSLAIYKKAADELRKLQRPEQ